MVDTAFCMILAKRAYDFSELLKNRSEYMWFIPHDVCNCPSTSRCCHRDRNPRCTLTRCNCSSLCCADACHEAKRFYERSDLTLQMVFHALDNGAPMLNDRLTVNQNISAGELLRCDRLDDVLNPVALALRSDLTERDLDYCLPDQRCLPRLPRGAEAMYHTPKMSKLNLHVLPFNYAISLKYLVLNRWIPYNRMSLFLRRDLTRWVMQTSIIMMEYVALLIDESMIPDHLPEDDEDPAPMTRIRPTASCPPSCECRGCVDESFHDNDVSVPATAPVIDPAYGQIKCRKTLGL